MQVTKSKLSKTEGIVLQLMISLYFCISAFEPYLNGAIGSLTKYYIFILIIALLIGNNLDQLTLQYIPMLFILWLGIKTSSLLWTQDYATPRLHWMSQYGMVLLLSVLLMRKFNRKTLRLVVDTCWLSSGILGLASLLLSKSYHSTIESRQVVLLFGVETDPNNQAALLATGVAISALNLMYVNREIQLSTIIALVNTYAILMTGSRSGLVAVLAIGLCCIAVSGTNRKDRIRHLLLLLFVGIVTFIIVQRFLPQSTYQRLFESDYGNGSGRTEMWKRVWNKYTSDAFTILFGAGWGTATITTGSSVAVHNTFLTLLMDVGLIGTAIMLLPVVFAVKKTIDNHVYLPLLLILAAFVPAFFIDAINKRFFWNAIIVTCLFYYNIDEAKHIFDSDMPSIENYLGIRRNKEGSKKDSLRTARL